VAQGCHRHPAPAFGDLPALGENGPLPVPLLGPEDFDTFEVGEVLVAQTTTPGWTPLFARAVAVVTDVGSVMAHASLVAREFGIPAVVGAGDATQKLRNGMLVTVDGSAGVVLDKT
jgi:pyruvate,water dikinase